MSLDEFKAKLDEKLSESRKFVTTKIEKYRKNARFCKAQAYWEGFRAGLSSAEIEVWNLIEQGNATKKPDAVWEGNILVNEGSFFSSYDFAESIEKLVTFGKYRCEFYRTDEKPDEKESV